MNLNTLRSYIQNYKRDFQHVHDLEIYKWEAIQHFQDRFNLNSEDFYKNLKDALEKTQNLLVSGNYFPRGMLIENTGATPEKVKALLVELYDEDKDVLARIERFRSDFKDLSKKNFPEKKQTYQDHRAAMVYLALRYPEQYYLYKFEMFKKFALKVGHPYVPVKGRIGNIGEYQSMCDLVRMELEKDNELLEMHNSRLKHGLYSDMKHTVLTQDFIYAVVEHLDEIIEKNTPPIKIEIIEALTSDFINAPYKPNFTGRTVNYAKKERTQKLTGDLGELWVLGLEKAELTEKGKPKLAKKVEHKAKTEGDGLGYDILSFDLTGKKKFIEVKTTKGGKNSPLYISRNELEKSKLEGENFYLYRVYDFDPDNRRGKLLIMRGELSKLCDTPVSYQVILKNATEDLA